MTSLLVWLILVSLALGHCQADSGVCVRVNPCSCKYANGSIIDLKQVNLNNGSAWYHNIKNDDYEYFYNPCTKFSLGPKSPNSCGDGVAVCQKDLANNYYNLGTPLQARFITNGSSIYISYLTLDSRFTNVTLVCDPTATGQGELKMLGEPLTKHYLMELRSNCACADACTQKAPDEPRVLSTGSVLVILFFVCLFCYLLGGVIFLKVIKGATGNELIPHYDFWMDFPLLVRDGCLFCSGGCQSDTSYDRI